MASVSEECGEQGAGSSKDIGTESPGHHGQNLHQKHYHMVTSFLNVRVPRDPRLSFQWRDTQPVQASSGH